MSALQLLVSLGSISEASFKNLEHRVQFTAFFSSQLRPLMNSAGSPEEFFNIGQIVEVYFAHIPVGPLAAAYGEEFDLLCKSLFTFSTKTMTLFSRDVEGNTKVGDTFEMVLRCWVALVQTDQCPQYAVEGAVQFFQIYIDARLHRARLELVEEEQRKDEDGSPVVDRKYFSEELECIAKLGRCASLNAITLLGRKITDCMTQLRQWSEGQAVTGIATVWEELHWLILFSTYLLTDDPQGETPSLAPELVLPNAALAQHLAEGGSDPLVALSDLILQLIDWGNQALQNHAAAVQEARAAARASGAKTVLIPTPMWSPLISEDLMWYLSRWSMYYLLIPPQDGNSPVPVRPSIMSRYGSNTQAGVETFNFVLQSTWITFCLYSAQHDTQYQACNVLSAIAARQFPSDLLVNSGPFRSSSLSHHSPDIMPFALSHFRFLSAIIDAADSTVTSVARDHIQRKFFKSLCQIRVGNTEVEQHQHLERILVTIEHRWARILQQRHEQEKISSREIGCILERCRGAVRSCSATTWQPILRFVNRMFKVWVQCLSEFHAYGGMYSVTDWNKGPLTDLFSRYRFAGTEAGRRRVRQASRLDARRSRRC